MARTSAAPSPATKSALRVQTEADFPSAWAGTQNNLGNAYSELPTGDRGENLRRAIACYESALRVYTEADFPSDWAVTQHNLGAAYRHLPTGDRGENLRRAIACYESALRVRTEADFPSAWASTQNNLGNAYSELPTGDRGENLRRAIACYESALRVRTEADFPSAWAGTQNNLGNAYSELPTGDRGENLRLPTGDRGENLRRAFTYYESALRVLTEADFLSDWARTQICLGNAYSELSAGDRGENLHRAIACYEFCAAGADRGGLPVGLGGDPEQPGVGFEGIGKARWIGASFLPEKMNRHRARKLGKGALDYLQSHPFCKKETLQVPPMCPGVGPIRDSAAVTSIWRATPPESFSLSRSPGSTQNRLLICLVRRKRAAIPDLLKSFPS